MAIPEHLLRVILDRFPAPGHAANIPGESEGLECYIRVCSRLWGLLGDGRCACRSVRRALRWHHV